MTESPESRVGKAAMADAAGIDHADASVRMMQRGGGALGGVGAGLGVLLLVPILVPFFAYHVAVLDAFTEIGFEVKRYEYFNATKVDETGLFFESRLVDAVFILVALIVGFFLLSPRIGYFLTVGLALVPIARAVAVGRDETFWSVAIPIALYVAGWLLKHPRFVLPV